MRVIRERLLICVCVLFSLSVLTVGFDLLVPGHWLSFYFGLSIYLFGLMRCCIFLGNLRNGTPVVGLNRYLFLLLLSVLWLKF